MGMKQVFALASAAFVAYLLSVTANGATIYQTTGDGGSKSSLTNWDASSTSPKGTPTSGNDYVSEKVVRTLDKQDTAFNGKSLRLGTVGGGEGTYVPYNGTVTFNNNGLILANGKSQPYSTGLKYTIAGLVTVTAPERAPFRFWLDGDGSKKSNAGTFSAEIAGAAGTCIQVSNRGEGTGGKFTLQPKTSEKFYGTLIVGTSQDFPAYDTKDRHAVVCEMNGSKVWAGTLWATSYAQLTPLSAGGAQWTIGSLRLDSDSTLLTKLTGDPKTSTITITNSLTTAYPVNLAFPSARAVDTGTGYIWNVLTLPVEKKDQIHPEHFKLVTQETAGLFPDAFPSVELRVTEKNDLAVLELVQRQVVQNKVVDDYGYGYSKQNFEFPTSMTNAMAWSNSNLPMANIDYIAAYDLNAATPSQCTDGAYTFPGASLTVKSGVTFCEAAHEFTIPVLRLESNARFWPLGEQYDDATAVVKGRIHVLKPTSSDYALLRVRRRSIVDIEAELTGTGNLQVQPNANDSTDSVAVFDHDNSAFLGKIRVQSNTYTNDLFTKGQTLVLKAANNVGGPLGEFAADALEVRYFSTLEVTNDLVFATENRGLTVNNARIRVGADATFTFANDITYAGPLVKVGAGRLVLGGSALGSKKTLTVEEGTLAVSKDAALDGVAVAFTGGALAVDPATSGEYGVRGPFTGNLPVAFDLPADEETHEYANVAVCTVDDSANVTPKAVRIPRHRVVFHWRDNGDNTKTLLADIGRTGFAIILR